MAQLALAWVGMMLFGDEAPHPNRRHIRERYGLLNLDRFARIISCLIVARAAELMPRLRRVPLRNHAHSGFRRRIRRGGMIRALTGSALRKRLKHSDLAQRFARLAHALRNLDALARQLMRRLRKGRSRYCAMLLVRPPHQRVFDTAPAHAPACADTS